MVIIGALVALIGVLGFVMTRDTGPKHGMLFSGLNPEDAGRVVQELQARKVPYEVENGGTAITVPEDQVHELRLMLSADGVSPSGGGVGFELFDKQAFGTTSFVERMNFRRALGGGLSRTIISLSTVDRARVHIAMGKRSLYSRESEPPSASVVLSLRAGQQLSRAQRRGIVNMVAASVDGLSTENVTLVDGNGNALTTPDGDGAANGATPASQSSVDDVTIIDDLVIEPDESFDDEPLLSDDLLAETSLIDTSFGAGHLGELDEFDEFDEFDDEVPRRSRSGLLLVLALIALVAAGVAAIVLSQRDPEPVIETFPAGTYVGRTLDDVQSDLALRGWDATVAYERADGTEAGDVLQQVPPPGTELEAGAAITLVVSEGPLLHLVPNVVGLTKPDALSSLAAAGLQVGLIDSSVNDEEVVVGSVVSQAIEPGTELETGATVDLAISAGPAPRTVPDLAGLTLDEATLLLTDLGLVVVPAEDYSQTVPEGEVIGSDPGLDATIARDAEITVTVSLGLPFVTVPDVLDRDVTEADQILTDAGLEVVDIVGPLTTVLNTEPEPGETVRQGTEIRIVTRTRR